MQPNEDGTCAREGCSCEIDMGKSYEQEGRQYCSETCADDQGCSHPACCCSMHPQAEAVPLGT
jgi:hypothetical protein